MSTTFLLAALAVIVLLALFMRRRRDSSTNSQERDESSVYVAKGPSATSESGEEAEAGSDEGQTADCGCSHDHDQSGHVHTPPEDLKPLDSDFSSVHRGKARAGGCKFDPDVVRRTRFAKTPAIDVSNLPAPDPRVVQAFQGIDMARIRDTMLMLSGEKAMTVGGKSVQISGRNTHTRDLDTAMSFLEELYAGMGLKAVRDSYKVRGRTLNNLILELPGKTQPSRVLILGAHLDSTAGNPWTAEAKAPGADDDGSGTSGTVELVRILKDMSLPFTVRIVHFTGEEQGLWGSYAYSDKVAAAKTDVIAMLEMDMIAYCAKPGNRVDIHDDVDENGSHELVVRFFRAIKRYNINLTPVDTHNTAVKDRSDHAGFLDHGYKAVLISEEFTDDGFNPNYHTTGDRVKACNLPYMVEVLKAVLAVTVELAGL